MAFEFQLPDIGEGVHEGEIVNWVVEEGDAVEEDEPIVEVMTDKATVEITSPRKGTIKTLHFEEGATVEVGQVLVTIAEEGDAAEPEPEQPEPEAAADASEEEEEEGEMLFQPPDQGNGGQRRRKPRKQTADGGGGAVQQQVETPEGRTLATPATRKLARELEVEIDLVPGSGEKGRVLKEDVRAFAEEGPAPTAEPEAGAPARKAAPGVQALQEDERVPLKGLRSRIHENMRRSKDYAAHFTYWEEVDVTELVELREDAKDLAEERGVNLTYLPFLVKASVAALKEYPDLNAQIDEDEDVLVRKADFNIGVAVATDRGLMVVNVRNADEKSVFEIAADIQELAGKARDGSASPEDLQDTTFTITSLGAQGGLGATPVINHPESAIMGVHKIRTLPRFDDGGEVEPREVMNLSWSFDHRWIDGHVGAEFAQKIRELLESPNLLLLGTQ